MTTAPVSSTSQFVEIEDLRLHYLDFGDVGLPPADDPRMKMLCLHGGAAQAHWYDFVLGPFLDEYRVLSLDLRGHGDSDWGSPDAYDYPDFAKDTAGFIRTLGIGPVLLVGHSMGGMVSIVTAANFPNAVARLVVIDSMMRMSEGRAAQLRRIGAGSGRAFDSKAAYVDGFKIRPEADLASPAVTRHMAASSCREYEDGQWRNKFDRHVYSQRHPVDGYAHWAKVWDARIPALLIAGGSSDRITAQVLDQLSAVHPQLTISTVDRAGHHVMLDNPRGFIEALAAYLEIDR